MNIKYLDRYSWLSKILISLTIILIIFLAYGDVRHHAFLNFDDNQYVTENIHVQNGINLQNIRWAFDFTGISYWHPLSWLSHMLDVKLFGLNPGAHHMVNVAFHILNAILLFLILFRATGAQYKAALVAILFAIHPLNVESVAWVTERKTVLSMFFLMMSLYAYVHYTEKNNRKLYFTSLLLYGLGLMCKPSIIMFPFLLLILDYWPLRRYEKFNIIQYTGGVISTAHSINKIFTFIKKELAYFIIEKIPFFLLSLLSSYISIISMNKYKMVIPHELVPYDLRIYNLFVSIIKYLTNMAWPVELSIFYPFPRLIPFTYFFAALAVVVVLTFAMTLLRKSHPWLFVGWWWFLIGLSSASGIIQAGLWPEMANRFMYIPMIGLFILMVWEGDNLIQGKYSTMVKIITCLALVSFFTYLTKIQNIYFSNSYSLFSRAVNVTENNYVAYNSIGSALLSLGRIDEAMPYFLKSIEINPNYALAFNNYGTCLSKKGEYKKAEYYYNQVISISPDFKPVYVNLAWNKNAMGEVTDAQRILRKVLEEDPDNKNANILWGSILIAQGQREEAKQFFDDILEKRPAMVLEARINIANMYEEEGRYDKAMEQHEIIMKMKPLEKGGVFYRMAGVKSQQNLFEECLKYLELSSKYGFDVEYYIKSDQRFLKFRESDLYLKYLMGKNAYKTDNQNIK